MFSIITTYKSKIMQHLSNPLYRNSYLLMIGTVFNSLVGFVALMVSTRFYSTEAVGISSAVLAAVALIGLISEVGLGISIIYYLPKAGETGNDLINTFAFTNISVSVVVTLIFIAGIKLWSPALYIIWQHPAFLFSFIFFSLVTSLQPVIINSFLAKRLSQYIVITNISAGVLRLLFIIICTFMMNNSLGLFVSTGLATTIGLVTAILYFLPRIQKNYYFHPKISIKILKEIFTYSISNFIARLLLQIAYPIISLMVVNILGAEKTAYFSIAWSISVVLCVIPSSSFNSLFAEVSNNENNLRSNLSKSLKHMLIIAIPAIIFTILISEKLLMLFGQGYSDNGTWLLRLLAASSLPWGINYLYVSIARSGNKMLGAIGLTVLSQGLSLILSYILMLEMDTVGIGIGYLCGQSIAAVIAILLIFRKYYYFRSNVT